MRKRVCRFGVAAGVIAGVCGPAFGAPRDVQFTRVDLAAGVIELTNLGETTVDLSGWRFCTHDEAVIRRYTGTAALNGVSLAPGERLAVHTLNDADEPGEINVALLGNFALPLDGDDAGDAYSIQIYFPPISFGNGATIADHLQFSFGGVDNLTADERSDEAEAGGVWTDQTTWIATDAATTSIHLKDACNNELHGPADYQTLPGAASPRDVQIRSIDLSAGVIELFNFGAVDADLSGWRFCTHDEAVIRRYTGSSSLNGITLPAGGSLFIHTLNDADEPGEINVALLGAFALPVDGDDPADAYAIQIYFPPVSFGNGNTIADHAQFSFGGVDNLTADERSDEAESGGVWVDQTEWIATAADSGRIELVGQCGRELHSPADYAVTAAPAPACAGDVNGDGSTDVFDFSDLAANFGAGPGATRAQGDLTGDGFVDVFDFSELAADFGCSTP